VTIFVYIPYLQKTGSIFTYMFSIVWDYDFQSRSTKSIHVLARRWPATAVHQIHHSL
jgi:hypothetical protein